MFQGLVYGVRVSCFPWRLFTPMKMISAIVLCFIKRVLFRGIHRFRTGIRSDSIIIVVVRFIWKLSVRPENTNQETLLTPTCTRIHHSLKQLVLPASDDYFHLSQLQDLCHVRIHSIHKNLLLALHQNSLLEHNNRLRGGRKGEFWWGPFFNRFNINREKEENREKEAITCQGYQCRSITDEKNKENCCDQK